MTPKNHPMASFKGNRFIPKTLGHSTEHQPEKELPAWAILEVGIGPLKWQRFPFSAHFLRSKGYSVRSR